MYKKIDKLKLVDFWPARQDLNLRPSESESDALSSCATGRYKYIIAHFCEIFNHILAINKKGIKNNKDEIIDSEGARKY